MVYEKISISLPRELAEQVEEHADQTDKPRSQIVQEALQRYFEAQDGDETLWESKIQETLNWIKSKLEEVLGSESPSDTDETSKEEDDDWDDDWLR